MGVTHRSLAVLEDVYIHYVGMDEDLAKKVDERGGHDLFREMSRKLDEYITPYDPRHGARPRTPGRECSTPGTPRRVTLEEARASLEAGDLERAREGRSARSRPIRTIRRRWSTSATSRSDRGRRTRRPSGFRQALEREPGNIDALRAIATIHGRSGRAEDAFDAALAVAKAQPDDPLAVLELAELALDMGRLDEASSAFQRLRSVDDNPSHEVYAFHGLIEVELRREDWRRALDLAVEAPRVDRAGRTTDILAYVVAQVLGQADRRGGKSSPRWRGTATSTAGCTWRRGTRPRHGSFPGAGSDVQWTRCPSCDAYVYHKRLKRQLGVCPECNDHFRIPLRERLEQLLDPGTFEELGGDLEPLDALGFVDSKPYSSGSRGPEGRRREGLDVRDGDDRRQAARDRRDRLRLRRRPHGIGRGEAITRAAELALEERTPLLVIGASGGARMQEGASR